MLRRNILALTLIAVALIIGSGASPCPISNYHGNVYSARILAALQGGVLPIQDGEDTQCYNYSLPYAFTIVPDVAVSVHDFEAETSNNLFFFIKPIKSDSLSFLPFVVRTQWPYTQWNHIQFSFLAEDRNDLEAGYYQIDSGPLSGCQNGKMIDVLLPFRKNFARGVQIKHNLFLHGFEIATVKTEGNSRSPFEFQIIASSTNVTGISITLSVTTTTQVNALYISYIAFQTSALTIVGGGFVYDVTENPSAGLYFAPQTNIPRNYARLYGLTGFLLNYNNRRISYSTKWDGFSFNFEFGVIGDRKFLQYFSFNYIFFLGSECQDCLGYEVFYNNACVSFCPAGTTRTTDNTCMSCGDGREWNGTQCVTSCARGQFLNITSGICECPPTLNWNGESCVPCLSGKVWAKESKSCQCPKPLVWNGFACAKIDPCTAGKVWDVYTYSCQCPETTYWNGQQCKNIPQCQGGQVVNSNYECVCLNGFVWDKGSCIYSPCMGGQVWTGTKCVCPAGLNFNGSMCLECINGQKWDAKLRACSCESGYKWNGQYCEKSYACSNGRVWNPTYQQCICPDKSYWSGYSCLPVTECPGGQYFDTTISKCVCLSGFQWNGKICVQCNNGRAWNVTLLTCTCPPGTVQFKNGCQLIQQCTGGKQWNANNWVCECPPQSAWNGNYCIANPCSNGRWWNETQRACQCMDNKVWINDACVPPQIVCTNGRVWNNYIYACACPQGTFSAPTRCDPMPVCTNGKVYNPLNNVCQCPFGLTEKGGVCTPANCPAGQYWSISTCQVINCPPPSYFFKDRCVYGDSNRCDFGYIWNGRECIFYPSSCPTGTTWNGQTCVGSGQCGTGYYPGPNGVCLPFPQQCVPPAVWDGQKCAVPNSNCPQGTYSQGNKCLPYEACKNGFVWDTRYLRCVCPPGTINNGNKCVECSNQQTWVPSIGCACPDGTFDTGARCQSPTASVCAVISNAIWSQGKCQCRPGFSKVGLQCVCYGTQTGDLCDKCSYKPNSRYVARSNTCECRDGFVDIRDTCVPSGQNPGNDDPNKCSVGTYFDKNNKRCLACPDGCLSCKDCYTCNICRPEFVYDYNTQKCVQYCGDGRRFTVECDDGNNNDGDGCSRDCRIEQGYSCSGGSPESADGCYTFRPERISIETIGQIRKSTSVTLNVKVNYMPSALLQSQECSNKCNQILTGTIVDGDRSSMSITSQYLGGTKYIFTVTIQFGRPYIARFKIQIGIANNLLKYFGGLRADPLEITVQPSYLSAIAQTKGSDTLA